MAVAWEDALAEVTLILAQLVTQVEHHPTAISVAAAPAEDVRRALCPHCDSWFEVLAKEINCGIFRHGVYRHNGEPVPPHAPQSECEHWVATHAIWGCGKPVAFDGLTCRPCDYV